MGPLPTPAAQGSLQLCRWLAGISSLLSSFPVHGALLSSHTLHFLSSSPLALSFRMWGDKERLQGLAKMLDQPQTLSHRLMAWQCSLLVMVGTQMVFAPKCQLFNESSGSRFKGEYREYAPHPRPCAKAPKNVPPCLIALFRDIYFSKWPHFSVTKTGILYQNLPQPVAICPASQT